MATIPLGEQLIPLRMSVPRSRVEWELSEEPTPIADDPAGASCWPTPEEAERAEKERALARVEALEAELARRSR
jgi:hypothetical protein